MVGNNFSQNYNVIWGIFKPSPLHINQQSKQKTMKYIFTFTAVCALLFMAGSVAAQTNGDRDSRIVRPNGTPKLIKFSKAFSSSNEALFKRELQLDEKESFRLIDATEDQLQQVHERHQQFLDGIKVEFGVYQIHKDKSGNILSMTGDFKPVKDVNTQPAISPSIALGAALEYVNAESYMWENEDQEKALKHDHHEGIVSYKPAGELVIVPDFNANDREKYMQPVLAYKFDIYAEKPLGRSHIYVSAQDGSIVFENAIIKHVGGTGATRYSGNRTVETSTTTGGYRLADTSRGNGVFTYDMNEGTNYNNAVNFVDNDNNWTAGEWDNAAKDNAALDAHWGAMMTYDYFLQTFNRDSYDNNGAAIRSYVHFDSNYENAFWDGLRMTYGDGASRFDALTSLDVAAHEIGHAVCEKTANLAYQRESGALNEGFSDIWGAAVEFFAAPEKSIWLIGEDIDKQQAALRSMSDPNSQGQPDTYGGTNWINPNCGTPTRFNDYCGVHTNSGVLNHWFYLLSVGKTGTNDIGNPYTVNGIGIAKAAQIAYRLEAVYLSANSTFADARSFGIQSAVDLYGAGSPEEIAVTDAWYAVGVGAAYGGGGAPSYCVSQGDNVQYEWIAGVEIGSFTNNSNAAGYTDFTSQTINVNTGSTSVTLTPGFASTSYNEYWKIWIDLNEDSDFDDPDELVFDAGTLSSNAVSGNMLIPASASGVTTRMRVSMKYNAAQTACETFTYGEVEDYTVTIGSGGGSDTEAPTAPGALASSSITSSGFGLSWNASTDNVGVTEYDISIDGSLNGSTSGTSYTVSGLSASTSYNVSVIAKDAAGNESSAATLSVTTAAAGGGTSVTLLEHYFESSYDGWTDGGSDCFRYNGSFSYEGSYSVRLRDNSGTVSSMTSSTYDVSAYDQLEIKFFFYPNSMESGEDFFVRYYDGSSWTTVATYASGSSFDNGSFYSATINLTSAEYNFPTNARFRIQCDASSNQDQVYIDQVTVVGSTGAGITTGLLASQPQLISTPGRNGIVANNGNRGIEIEEDAAIYPNPGSDFITIFTTESIKSIAIYSVNGALAHQIKQVKNSKVNISGLKPGFYMIRIETEEETFNKRFIKH